MFLDFPQRKEHRLKGYDYSQSGAYFITICVKDKRELLWTVGARIARPADTLPLSQHGLIVKTAIESIPLHYQGVHVDQYAVMPNHVHFILRIQQDGGRALRAPTVSTMVNQMKGYATKKIGFSIWQKLFYDHIIRNEQDYWDIWGYIHMNPLKWEEDCFYNKSAELSYKMTLAPLFDQRKKG